MPAEAGLIDPAEERSTPPGFDTAQSRVLVIDDEPANVELLLRVLKRGGYAEIQGATDPRRALPLCEEYQPDLVLLDLQMPHISGFEILRVLRQRLSHETYLPVLVLTGNATPQARNRALQLGASDFVTKPFDVGEVLLRVRNLLQTRWLHQRLELQNRSLEEQVATRTRELEEARFEIVERLAQAAEFRDDDTGQHTYRVGGLSALLARKLALPDLETDLIRRAAPLHDVGKIGIPDAILLKPGRFTEDEMAVMKTHTRIGARLLAGGRSELIRLAEQIALAHHERWDGTGYPNGAGGEDIPIAARIVGLADFFDALAHDRPYRRAWRFEDILDEVRKQSGLHFDPRVVEAFFDLHATGELEEYVSGNRASLREPGSFSP